MTKHALLRLLTICSLNSLRQIIILYLPITLGLLVATILQESFRKEFVSWDTNGIILVTCLKEERQYQQS